MDVLLMMILSGIVYVITGALLFAGFIPGYSVVMLGERLQSRWVARVGWTLAFTGWIAGSAAFAIFLA